MVKEDIIVIKSLLDKLQNTYDTLHEKHGVNLERVKTLDECQHALQAIQEENRQLKQKIELLEQNYKEFSRVSHVVALEKENAKLRNEVAKLKAPSQKPIEHAQTPQPEPELPAPIENTQTTQNQPEPELAPQHESEPEEEFYEKKIKGVVYYVSNLTNKIFQKTEDDEIGQELGFLQKETKNQKTVTKVVWL